MGWIIGYFLIGFVVLVIFSCFFDEEDFEDSNLGLACIAGWPIFILIMIVVIIALAIAAVIKEICFYNK